MSTAARLNLIPALVMLCDDAFFAITASGRLDGDLLRALAKRRAPTIAAAARAVPSPGMESWEEWLLPLCAAIAPLGPPHWLPMGDVVNELSLEHGARGMRSIFTSKPSDKEVARVRSMGSLAVRALGSVLGATGAFHAEARLTRGTLIASLGLPEADQRLLNTEEPTDAEALEIQGNMDSKVAKAIVRGGFYAAMNDGMDPREEQAVVAIARKCGLTTDEVNVARIDARKKIDSSKDFGEACVDAIRYLYADLPAEGDRLGIAAAKLTLPVIQRKEAVTAINVGGGVTFGRKHPLDRRQREAVLALSWVSVLRGDPTTSRRAELAARHNRVAIDLGEFSDGPAARTEIDRLIDAELCTVIEAPTG